MKFYLKVAVKKNRAINSLKQFKQQFYFSYFNDKWIKATRFPNPYFKTTIWQKRKLGRCRNVARSISIGKQWRWSDFREARKERKTFILRARNATGCTPVVFTGGQYERNSTGSLNKSLDRDYYWKSRPRMLFKHRAKTGIRGVERKDPGFTRVRISRIFRRPSIPLLNSQSILFDKSLLFTKMFTLIVSRNSYLLLI